MRKPENPENYRIRSQRMRERIKTQGLKRVEFLIKPEWLEKIKKFINKLKINEKKT